jgi:hypothetical protein
LELQPFDSRVHEDGTLEVPGSELAARMDITPIVAQQPSVDAEGEQRDTDTLHRCASRLIEGLPLCWETKQWCTS